MDQAFLDYAMISILPAQPKNGVAYIKKNVYRRVSGHFNLILALLLLLFLFFTIGLLGGNRSKSIKIGGKPFLRKSGEGEEGGGAILIG